jgi:hypothetical protein
MNRADRGQARLHIRPGAAATGGDDLRSLCTMAMSPAAAMSPRRTTPSQIGAQAADRSAEVLAEMLQDPQFRAEWERTALARAVAEAVIRYRAELG